MIAGIFYGLMVGLFVGVWIGGYAGYRIAGGRDFWRSRAHRESG